MPVYQAMNSNRNDIFIIADSLEDALAQIKEKWPRNNLFYTGIQRVGGTLDEVVECEITQIEAEKELAAKELAAKELAAKAEA